EPDRPDHVVAQGGEEDRVGEQALVVLEPDRPGGPDAVPGGERQREAVHGGPEHPEQLDGERQQQERPDQRRHPPPPPALPRWHRRPDGGVLHGGHDAKTCSAAACQSRRCAGMSPGSAMNRVSAASAVVCRASLESRLKNCVISCVELSSSMPFCTSGLKPEVSTSGEVGRLDEPDLVMNSC